MKPLVNLTMFRGYVNKILPTVYDDSLSYYEVLAKVMEKLNEVIELDNAQNEIINNLPLDVSSFAEELAEFKADMTQQFNDYKEQMNASLDAFEDEINAKIVTDSAPTQGSTNLVTSGGVYAALKDITDSLIKDALPTQGSDDFVTSGGVYTAIQTAVDNINVALATKQNTLTFDTTPTENSTNPVQSGGIKTYVDTKTGNVQTNLNTYITNNDARSAAIEGDITDLETGKQDNLNFDTVPTLNSQNPVTSDGIARAIAGVTPEIDIDPTPTSGSTNPVSSNGVYVAVNALSTATEQALEEKQNLLNFDVMPTQNSLNPVTSGGVWQALSQIDPTGTIDPEPTEGSTAAVSSGGTWSALQTLNNTLSSEIDEKQDALVFDNTPTINSGHPVTSDGIYRALQEKQSALTFDSTPTQYSTNPVTSGGVYDAIQGGGGGGIIDPTPTQGSTNAVQSGGTWTALQSKQNTLTFDSTPTQNSLNPVTSGGVWAAIQGGGGGGASTDDIMHQSAYAMLSAGTATSSFSLSRSYGGLYPDSSWQYASGTPRVYTDLARFSNVYGENGLLYWLHNEYLTNTAYPNNNGQVDFIKIGDYFQFTTSENYRFTMRVAGIDTYWNMGNPSQDAGIGHHIDFISDELYPTEHIFTTSATAVGTGATREPWLLSDLYFWLNSLAGTTQSGTAVDYTASGVLSTLPAEIADNISSKISCLVQQTSSTPDNFSYKPMGKLWVPTEVEIYGRGIMGQNLHYQAGQIQYALYANNGCNIVKYASGTAHRYWLQSYRDNSAQSIFVETDGTSYNGVSNMVNVYAPICFRVDITNY